MIACGYCFVASAWKSDLEIPGSILACSSTTRDHPDGGAPNIRYAPEVPRTFHYPAEEDVYFVPRFRLVFLLIQFSFESNGRVDFFHRKWSAKVFIRRHFRRIFFRWRKVEFTGTGLNGNLCEFGKNGISRGEKGLQVLGEFIQFFWTNLSIYVVGGTRLRVSSTSFTRISLGLNNV